MSIMRRQWTTHTCVPACVVYVYEKFDVKPEAWSDTLAVLGTTKKGTDLQRVPLCFTNSRWDVRRVKGVKRELQAVRDGFLVIASFTTLRGNGHAVALNDLHVGELSLYDPVLGFNRCWSVDRWARRRRPSESYAIRAV